VYLKLAEDFFKKYKEFLKQKAKVKWDITQRKGNFHEKGIKPGSAANQKNKSNMASSKQSVRKQQDESKFGLKRAKKFSEDFQLNMDFIQQNLQDSSPSLASGPNKEDSMINLKKRNLERVLF